MRGLSASIFRWVRACTDRHDPVPPSPSDPGAPAERGGRPDAVRITEMSFVTLPEIPTTRSRRLSLGLWLRRVGRETLRFETGATRLEKQVRDYTGGGLALFWKRQGIYAGAALLSGYYYSLTVSVLCYLFIQAAELFDTTLCLKIRAWPGGSLRQARRFRNLLMLSSIFSSTAICVFVVLVAWMEGTANHFMPLFFLFAAGLFAAVNNHQIPQILYLRLVMYVCVFLYIPLNDIWRVRPPLESVLWLQFATVIFVLFFVVECSIIFLSLYRKGLDQLDELRTERDRAQAAFEVKSQFVSIVSHELRTPLTSINGALGLLRTGAYDSDPDKAKSILEIAHKNSVRLSALINDLLDLQKLEAGQMTYDFQPTDLPDLVAESIESIAGFATGYGVAVRLKAPDGALHVRADRARIQQVLDNLLSNAVKFSRKGGHVDVTVETDAKVARVSVRDYGVGIPEGSREKVFGRFSQVDSSDRRAHGGTGLGLCIAQEIMTAHDGTIDYVSTLGEGTTFAIEFPLKD